MVANETLNVEETLRKLIIKVTHREDVVWVPSSTFKELGADSLDVVQILVSLEDALDIDLEDEELKLIKNMGDFINYLNKKVAEKQAAK